MRTVGQGEAEGGLLYSMESLAARLRNLDMMHDGDHWESWARGVT